MPRYPAHQTEEIAPRVPVGGLWASFASRDIQSILRAAAAVGYEVTITAKGTMRMAPATPISRHTSPQREAIERERARQKVYAKRRRELLGSSAGWRALRRAVLARDNYGCVYCGNGGGKWPLECDHIVAVTKGGRSTPENLATSCKSCNSSKRNADLQLWKPRA